MQAAFTDDVADLAIGLSIATLRRICGADRYLRSGSWKINGDFRLCSKFSGKAVGIVGLGRIGSAIAERAVAFGCMVSYHSRTERPGTNYKHYSNIVDLAANSKVLMLSCSLADQTRHIIIRDVIDALGPEGVLVNIGRGALVNEPELVSALIENRLVGAGLDVFEHEPGVPEELVGLDITWSCCHTSGLTRGKLARHGRFGAWEKAHFQKKPLLTPVV